MRRLGRWFVYWMPPAVWAAAIFGLSSLSSLPRPPAYPGEDKVVHVLLFSVLALLLQRALAGERRMGPGKAAALAFLAASLYGALDELHQHFVPLRTMAVADWLADTLGAAVVFLAARGARIGVVRE